MATKNKTTGHWQPWKKADVPRPACIVRRVIRSADGSVVDYGPERLITGVAAAGVIIQAEENLQPYRVPYAALANEYEYCDNSEAVWKPCRVYQEN